ncbi:MAG: thioredoxin family protein [Alphaproteobacteria bacterium]
MPLPRLNRRKVLTGLAATVTAALTGGGPAIAQSGRNMTVIELFTSQGCSSCPPADDFLRSLSSNMDVVPLAYHVDYWDYLGWKDPFSSRWATMLQAQYHEGIQGSRLATPQMIINGRHIISGNRRRDVNRLLQASRSGDGANLRMSIGRNARGLELMVGDTRQGPRLDVIQVKWLGPRHTEIRRGENGGRALAYHRVAQTRSRIGAWDGTANTFQLPDPGPIDPGGGVAILLQEPGPGRIHGVATLRG